MSHTKAGQALLDELAESPLPGARYARDVVARRLEAIEREATVIDEVRLRDLESQVANLEMLLRPAGGPRD